MSDREPDRQPPANGKTSADTADWTTLLGQAVDDIARILRSEAEIVQTRIGASLSESIASSMGILPMLILVVWGAGCLLLASILLMHLWVPLWQAFAVAGVCIMAIGAVGIAIMRHRPEQISSK